jgi:hypothetical protein
MMTLVKPLTAASPLYCAQQSDSESRASLFTSIKDADLFDARHIGDDDGREDRMPSATKRSRESAVHGSALGCQQVSSNPNRITPSTICM